MNASLEVVLNKVTQFMTALLGLFGIEVDFSSGSTGSGLGIWEKVLG